MGNTLLLVQFLKNSFVFLGIVIAILLSLILLSFIYGKLSDKLLEEPKKKENFQQSVEEASKVKTVKKNKMTEEEILNYAALCNSEMEHNDK